MAFQFSIHALQELARRGIPADVAQKVLDHPEQIAKTDHGREVYQSRIDFGEGKLYLVRVIVDPTTDPAVVITAYRTSKIAKYWIQP